MQVTEYNTFSSINTNGVTVADTFNTWRKSTNGIIQKLTVEAGSPTWDSSGKVSIGGVVANGAASTLDIGVARTGSGDAILNLGSVANSNNVVINRASGANGTFTVTNNGTGLFSISQAAAGDMRLLTSAAERVRILASGNVGIGTAAPTELLHVVGNFKVTGAISSGAISSGAISSSATIGGTDITASGILKSQTLGIGASNTAFTVASDGAVSAKRLLVGDGTAVAPSITFSADGSTDTGFNHTTDGAIQVVCNAVVAGTFTSTGFGGNSATATTLSTNSGNWLANGVISAVVGQLAWKNFGSGHTIFDASAGTSPSGGAVDNANPGVPWAPTYPSLMGWNGSNTYGVRVDSARVSDYATTTSTANYANYAGAAGGFRFQADAGVKSIVACSNYITASFVAEHYDQCGYGFHTPGSRGVYIQHLRDVDGIRILDSNSSFAPVRASAFPTGSSIKFKENVQPLNNALSIVESMQGVTFDWKASGEPSVGFIAEDVYEVLPTVVSLGADGLPEAVDYSKITAVLVEAVKQLSARVTALESAQQ
jgi:hypothetical protein